MTSPLHLEAEEKALAARLPFLETLAGITALLARSEMRFAEDGTGLVARLRRYDVRLRGAPSYATRDQRGMASVEVGGRGCSPRLAVTLGAGITGPLPEDPAARTMAVLAHAHALSTDEPRAPVDDAASLARTAERLVRAENGSVEVVRPAPHAPARIALTSHRGSDGRHAFSIDHAPSPDVPASRAFDALAVLATPRLAVAGKAIWRVDGGGGRALSVMRSTVGAGAPLRPDAMDELRQAGAWHRELVELGLA